MHRGNKIVFSLRLGQCAYAKIKRIAQAQRRSVNSLLENIVDAYVVQFEAEAGTSKQTSPD